MSELLQCCQDATKDGHPHCPRCSNELWLLQEIGSSPPEPATKLLEQRLGKLEQLVLAMIPRDEERYAEPLLAAIITELRERYRSQTHEPTSG